MNGKQRAKQSESNNEIAVLMLTISNTWESIALSSESSSCDEDIDYNNNHNGFDIRIKEIIIQSFVSTFDRQLSIFKSLWSDYAFEFS